MDLFKSYPVGCKKVVHRTIGPTPLIHYPSGFFDGAAASNIGGAVFTLLISDSHHFHVKMGCGANTNTRAKLMALWSLLTFATNIGLPTLTIFGDSLVIINWANFVASLAVLDLEHWCTRISEAKACFLSINFQHVYREHNRSVDGLSKEALVLELGRLSFTEHLEGEEIGGDTLQFF